MNTKDSECIEGLDKDFEGIGALDLQDLASSQSARPGCLVFLMFLNLLFFLIPKCWFSSGFLALSLNPEGLAEPKVVVLLWKFYDFHHFRGPQISQITDFPKQNHFRTFKDDLRAAK